MAITSAKDFEMLRAHVGHKIVCGTYSDKNNTPIEVCLACEDCQEILYSVDPYDDEDVGEVDFDG